MTIANQYANPTRVGLITYIGVAYNFLVDLYIFKSTFTLPQLLGVTITLSSAISAGLYKMNLEAKKQAQESQEKGIDVPLLGESADEA